MASQFFGTGVGSDAPLVTFDTSATLSAERVLTAGTRTTINTSTAGQIKVDASATTPGGSTTQVQFNDSSAFGGDADLTWDKTYNTLTAGSVVLSGDSGTSSYTTPTVTGTNLAASIAINPGNAADNYGSDVTIHGSNVASFNGAILNLSPGTSIAAGTASLSGATVALSADAIHLSEYITSSVVFQVYDADGFAWKTFITTTAGNTPDMTIAFPGAGSTLVLQPSTYKSSDGSIGATQDVTTGTLVGKTMSFKNGLLVSFA